MQISQTQRQLRGALSKAEKQEKERKAFPGNQVNVGHLKELPGRTTEPLHTSSELSTASNRRRTPCNQEGPDAGEVLGRAGWVTGKGQSSSTDRGKRVPVPVPDPHSSDPEAGEGEMHTHIHAGLTPQKTSSHQHVRTVRVFWKVLF